MDIRQSGSEIRTHMGPEPATSNYGDSILLDVRIRGRVGDRLRGSISGTTTIDPLRVRRRCIGTVTYDLRRADAR